MSPETEFSAARDRLRGYAEQEILSENLRGDIALLLAEVPAEGIYSHEQQRVCDYLQTFTKGQIGCGDDPVGFLLASHSYAMDMIRGWNERELATAIVESKRP